MIQPLSCAGWYQQQQRSTAGRTTIDGGARTSSRAPGIEAPSRYPRVRRVGAAGLGTEQASQADVVGPPTGGDEWDMQARATASRRAISLVMRSACGTHRSCGQAAGDVRTGSRVLVVVSGRGRRLGVDAAAG